MLLYHDDEAVIMTKLYRINNMVKLLICSTENPIRASIEAAAIYKKRAKSTNTIRNNLREFSRELTDISRRLINIEAMDSSFLVSDKAATEMLLAQESSHGGRLHSMFDAGPIAVAMDSKLATFIAQPTVNRLIAKSWWGGDWSYPLSTKLRSYFKRGDKLSSLSSLDQVDMNILLPEIAQPHHSVSCPAVRFIFERVMDFLFAFLLVFTILQQRRDPSFSIAEEILAVFMFGSILFEIGQLLDAGFKAYIKDRWNIIDIFLYGLYLTYFIEKLYARDLEGIDQYYQLNFSFSALALTMIIMSFKLLYVSILQQTLGVFVLMVMKMIADLGVFLYLFFALAIGFSVTMFALYNSQPGYYTYSQTLMTLFAAALGGFDYDALRESGEWGQYGQIYWGGTILLTIYLLLVLILLLNLLIAKFSSTYESIYASAHPKWSLLKANAVADCQTSRSFFCVLPAPFNIFTITIFILSYIFFKIINIIYTLCKRRDEEFYDEFNTPRGSIWSITNAKTERSKAAILIASSFTVSPFPDTFANKKALIFTDMTVRLFYCIGVSIPSVITCNVFLSIFWFISQLQDSSLKLKDKLLSILPILFRLIFITIFSPFVVGYWVYKGDPDGIQTESFERLIEMEPESLKEAKRRENYAYSATLFEIFRQKKQIKLLKKKANVSGLVDFETFYNVLKTLKPRLTFEFEDMADEYTGNDEDKSDNSDEDNSDEDNFNEDNSNDDMFDVYNKSSKNKKKKNNNNDFDNVNPLWKGSHADGHDSDDSDNNIVDDDETNGIEMKRQKSKKIQSSKFSKLLYGNDANLFDELYEKYNIYVSKIPFTIAQQWKIKQYKNTEDFLKALFEKLVALQEKSTASKLNVNEFFEDMTPFLPNMPKSFIKASVYHLEPEDVVQELRKHLNIHQDMLNAQIEDMEDKLNNITSSLATMNRLHAQSSRLRKKKRVEKNNN